MCTFVAVCAHSLLSVNAPELELEDSSIELLSGLAEILNHIHKVMSYTDLHLQRVNDAAYRYDGR